MDQRSGEFIGFGAMDVTKPYEFTGFGAMDVTKPYEFIGFGELFWHLAWAQFVSPPVPGSTRLCRRTQALLGIFGHQSLLFLLFLFLLGEGQAVCAVPLAAQLASLSFVVFVRLLLW